jgi:hypothetical protein
MGRIEYSLPSRTMALLAARAGVDIAGHDGDAT